MRRKIRQFNFPYTIYSFDYEDERAKKQLAFNSKIRLKKAARKHHLSMYEDRIDCGDFYGEALGERVPIDTLGKFLFGMTRFRSAILTIPYEEYFEILFYTDDEAAISLILLAADKIGLINPEEGIRCRKQKQKSVSASAQLKWAQWLLSRFRP